MESWFKTQYKLTTRRYKTLKIPRKLKNLLTGPSDYTETSASNLIDDESFQMHRIVDHGQNNNGKTTRNINNKRDKPRPELWRSFSLQSLRSRREIKLEQKKRPMIPPVMKTYDKGVKVGHSEQWL